MAASQRYATAYDYEAITVSTTAVGLTSTKVTPSDAANTPAHGKAFEVFISVETNGIRYRIDGTDPTASEGHPVASGEAITITGYNNIRRLKMIRSGAADAAVKVTFFR